MAESLLAGRYEVRTLIGRGGMAQVHLGYDIRLSRVVAIKMLRTDLARDSIFQARFRRDAQSAASLNHPNIVAVYDTGEETVTTPDGSTVQVPYIIMEYVEGHTVRDLLSDGSPVPIDEAIEIMTGVLQALEYAHSQGLVHRDIKPGNVMLTTTGKVKVMDFGIARALADSSATMTQTDAVVGTAQYLSPEQARGEKVDNRSDLYSAGCLLYELLTGRPPFTGDTAVAVAYQHVSKVPTPPAQITPDIPDALNRVVMKSLAKAKEDRYGDAGQMLQDLVAAGRGARVGAPGVDTWGEGETQVLTRTDELDRTRALSITQQQSPIQDQAALRRARQEAKRVQAQKDKKRRRRNRIIGVLVSLLAIAAVAAVAYLFIHGQKDPNENKVAVPANIVGMSRAEARTELSNAGLTMVEGEPEESDTVEADHVISSTPEPGTQVDKGSKVTVIISKGRGEIQVPDLAGMSQEQARSTLEAAGLSAGSVSTQDSGTVPKDQVITSDPEAGTKVAKGTTINLIVGSGMVNVPQELVGKSKDEVVKFLQENGLSITITEVETGAVPAGNVASLSAVGQVKQGTSITVNVAKAPASPSPSPSQSTKEPGNKDKESSDSGNTGNNQSQDTGNEH